MFFVTGDTHGDFTRIEKFCRRFKTSKSDCLVIVGDVGVNFNEDARDDMAKEYLSDMPITIFAVHGNHEARPQNFDTYMEIEWCGATAYAEPMYPSLIFAKDGEIYDFDGKKTFVCGGAYSVDKPIRLAEGYKWWPDEQPSEETKKYCEKQLDGACWNVDVVLTHTVPFKYIPRDTFTMGDIDPATIDNSTELWLDTIEDRLTYKKWYAGHFHIERLVDNLRIVFNDFCEL